MMARVTFQNVNLSLYYTTKYSSKKVPSFNDKRIIYHNKMSEIQALKNISFEAKDGDRIGLIGKNGSGKTTLIKLIAGHLTETAGKLSIQGQVRSQISLGSGIKADLSARENAFIKCLYFNIDKSLIRNKIAEIERISELGDFFDLPVGIYSSGMKAQFIMSLLSIVQADILVIDEWIGTIDSRGANKKGILQEEVLSKPNIVFLASHSDKLISTLTNKCIWLHDGHVRKFGLTEDVLPAYKNFL